MAQLFRLTLSCEKCGGGGGGGNAFSAEGTRRLVRTGENNEEAFTMNNSELCDNTFNKKAKVLSTDRETNNMLTDSSML